MMVSDERFAELLLGGFTVPEWESIWRERCHATNCTARCGRVKRSASVLGRGGKAADHDDGANHDSEAVRWGDISGYQGGWRPIMSISGSFSGRKRS